MIESFTYNVTAFVAGVMLNAMPCVLPVTLFYIKSGLFSYRVDVTDYNTGFPRQSQIIVSGGALDGDYRYGRPGGLQPRSH